MYIAIAGQLQFGKDTTADYLHTKLNERLGKDFWRRSAFAYNVKRIFNETFGKDNDYIEKWKVQKGVVPPDLDMEVRTALQYIGDGFRKIKSSIWIDLVFRDKSPQILSDCRYLNELKAIDEHNGFSVLLVNPARLNSDPNGSEAEIRPLVVWAIENRWNAENHLRHVRLIPEEFNAPAAMKHVNYVLFNDGSKEELYSKISDKLVPDIEEHFSL